MSLAQVRFRLRRKGESSSSFSSGEAPGGGEDPAGGVTIDGGAGSGWEEIAAAAERKIGSGGGSWTGGFWIQPAFLRKVVERAP